MRSPLLSLALVACLQCGCGTVHNMMAPPAPGPPGIGPSTCFPFGGVTRSALLGAFGTVCGLSSPLGGIDKEQMLAATGTFGLGVGALVDTPISLAGDIVTFPVAYARWKGAPWATWWGTQPQGPLIAAQPDSPAATPEPPAILGPPNDAKNGSPGEEP